jgi:hypothetical protein
MLVALRFVLARFFTARWPLIVAAATTAVATMPAMAEQMHPDEQDENHNPHPVLR